MDIFRALIGICFLVGIAYLFSTDRRSINWRLVLIGIGLQVLFGILITHVPQVSATFDFVSKGFVRLLNFSTDGAIFLFGGLAKNSYIDPAANHNLGVVFAFHILPTIIFFSTLTAALYYLGILQKIVYGVAWVMSRAMGLSGSESLSAAGNIFLGQTEAPLLVKPFIKNMTRSEIMCLMTGGMATIAGGVLAAYVSYLGGDNDAEKVKFASHLLSASIMSAPAAIVLAKMIIPETTPEKIDKELKVNKESIGVNLIDAMTNGATQGVSLAINVGGMLLAFIAVVSLLNYFLFDLLGSWEFLGINQAIESQTSGAFKGLNLEYIFGQAFRLLAFIIGIDWQESLQVGSLLGTKTVINEFIAYENLAQMKASGLLSEKSVIISTYLLCGFSNFGSIAIQIGGIGGIAPNQQATLSKLGFRALLAATLACMMTGTIAGAL